MDVRVPVGVRLLDRLMKANAGFSVARMTPEQLERAQTTVIPDGGPASLFLGQAHGVEQGDLAGGASQPDAAATTAHRLDEAILHQRLDQLEQEQFRDRVGLGDVGDPAQARIVDRAVDERADGVVGLSGQAHEHSTGGGNDWLARRDVSLPREQPGRDDRFLQPVYKSSKLRQAKLIVAFRIFRGPQPAICGPCRTRSAGPSRSWAVKLWCQ